MFNYINFCGARINHIRSSSLEFEWANDRIYEHTTHFFFLALFTKYSVSCVVQWFNGVSCSLIIYFHAFISMQCCNRWTKIRQMRLFNLFPLLNYTNLVNFDSKTSICPGNSTFLYVFSRSQQNSYQFGEESCVTRFKGIWQIGTWLATLWLKSNKPYAKNAKT